MAEIRIHQLTQVQQIAGNEVIPVDNSSYSNAMAVTTSQLAEFVLKQTAEVMHAETLYYLMVANQDLYAVGEVVFFPTAQKPLGISLDDVEEGQVMRVAYAGKCQVRVPASVSVQIGDAAIFNTTTLAIDVGNGNEISNRIGVFLENSAGGSDRLVWVLLKL